MTKKKKTKKKKSVKKSPKIKLLYFSLRTWGNHEEMVDDDIITRQGIVEYKDTFIGDIAFRSAGKVFAVINSLVSVKGGQVQKIDFSRTEKVQLFLKKGKGSLITSATESDDYEEVVPLFLHGCPEYLWGTYSCIEEKTVGLTTKAAKLLFPLEIDVKAVRKAKRGFILEPSIGAV